MSIPEQNINAPARLLAKLVRELITRDRFESWADLTDALKCRCARLRIRPTPDDISEAFRLVESNTALVGHLPAPVVAARVPDVTFSRGEAVMLLRDVNKRLGTNVRPFDAIQKLHHLSDDELRRHQFRDDQWKAYRLVQQQILESARKAAALESENEP